MPRPLIAIDFETYYDSEYSLRKMSTWAYVNDPRFDAYLVALHGDGVHWVGDPKKCDWSAIKEAVVVMHNASFDQMVLERLIEQGVVPQDCRPARVLCTADMTAYLGCKRDLASAAKFLLHKEISKQVRTNMQGKHYADAVAAGMEEDLLKYGGSDAELCFELARTFLPKWPETEQQISCLNREAGMKGVAIDVRKVEEASRTLRLKLEELEQLLPWMDDPEAKPLSPKAIRAAGREAGIPVPASLAKDDPAVLDWVGKYGEQYPWVKALGQYRSLNILLKRVQSIERNLRADGTMPFQIKYAGAHTLRFSGGGDSGGKFNMQNMYKHEMFGVDLRSMLIPRPGHKFLIADFCQIEARVLLWRVGDTEFVDYIKRVGNLYIAYAKKALGKDVVKGTFDYAMAKAAVLLLGYYGGWKKFQGMVAKPPYNIAISDEVAQATVKEYRESNPRIVNHWYSHQKWLRISAIDQDATHEVALPNGRILRYFEPRPDGNEITAMNELGGNRFRLHAGILTNNEIQSISRDILCDAWLALDAAGIPVLWSVHDELVFEVLEDQVDAAIPRIRELMTTSSPWAAGCPLDVEITVADRYCKD